ncbi:hypothetical protein METHB2_610008 [Candidatus Methylobacter favarea]|uniref:Uncharacterized protein n=1 Tax=Candidatus Methylobacter favarea TaxID=2707345 RepID=A0A8S0XI12_9GAMM|nr:hypothetical protein [Candidatus Methylobacter favarea]CAA9892243.1 hypothetical protein METHB2_610008 [Candidatus Methylobacter favarea]
MIKLLFPAFIRSVRTSRLCYASHNPHAAYQRLAAIAMPAFNKSSAYLLRLAVGLQKKLTRAQPDEFFEDGLGRLSGLDWKPFTILMMKTPRGANPY